MRRWAWTTSQSYQIVQSRMWQSPQSQNCFNRHILQSRHVNRIIKHRTLHWQTRQEDNHPNRRYIRTIMRVWNVPRSRLVHLLDIFITARSDWRINPCARFHTCDRISIQELCTHRRHINESDWWHEFVGQCGILLLIS